MRAHSTKIILLIGALIVFVLLFIAPKTNPVQGVDSSSQNTTKTSIRQKDANLTVYLETAVKNLNSKLKSNYDSFIATNQLDSLVLFWNRLKRPDLSAHTIEQIAGIKDSANIWFLAGNRYYYSVPFINDKSEEPVLYESAMRCFEKGLLKESDNIDAKIMLASCYVESGIDPMQGINQLKEVEKKDSLNAKLQLTFAFFSMKSGQIDKAVSRFEKVLQIDPDYIEAYLHLADIYEQKGENDKTIKMLELYAGKTNDVTARIEINKYIEQLRKN